jgi:S1-C subfamily serine protease
MIGGFIMAAIAPTYLFGKVIPYPENNKVDTTQLAQQVVIKPTEDITIATAVSMKVKPAVVGISTISVETNVFGNTRPTEGVGSGFIVDSRGYIVTNAHVVGDNPKEITVYFIDGKELPGEVLWKDTTLDMAVIKVDATNLPIVELGDSDTIQVGELAIAIGNPLGLRYDRTVTQGIISGLNRTIQVTQSDIMEDLIQTDAAINPGNSGGPLINNEGHIIGINTAKATAESLGFAIPINIAKPIISQLINEGKFQATYLGIGLLDREIAGYLDTDIQIKKGIYITSILQGYAADKSGLKPEDVITHVDGIEVNTMVKFKSVLYSKKPGDKITIKYERENKAYETEATLMAKPEE